ncbi:MAG: type II toxin-antitoxin system VapC family toxin [Anaerolineae bacterium]
MRLLLDTHTFLWWVTDDVRLSSQAYALMTDGDNELYFSAASGWEIAIKAHLGKLKLPDNAPQFVMAQLAINAIDILPVQLHHALHVYTLPMYHRDPFDRMLIAQSQLEELPIITADPQISNYAVNVIW